MDSHPSAFSRASPRQAPRRAGDWLAVHPPAGFRAPPRRAPPRPTPPARSLPRHPLTHLHSSPIFPPSRTTIPYTQCEWKKFAEFNFGDDLKDDLATILEVIRIGYAEGAAWAEEHGFTQRGRA